MKGIILAGGKGTRLGPLTLTLSKQLLPVYDKPMIYYPLSTLMMAGIREILLISTADHIGLFRTLLGDGTRWGMSIQYLVQHEPAGIAQAMVLSESFVDGQPSCLVLGDNLFYGQGLIRMLRDGATLVDGAQVFAYEVRNPRDYGVVSFDESGQVTALEEKPTDPQSNFVVPGLYFYDGKACEYAKRLKPSARGELEITDLNREYLKRNALTVEPLGRGLAWLDTGTPENLHDASSFVGAIEKRTGLKVCCPEEIAYRNGWIDSSQLARRVSELENSQYGEYLSRLLQTE